MKNTKKEKKKPKVPKSPEPAMEGSKDQGLFGRGQFGR